MPLKAGGYMMHPAGAVHWDGTREDEAVRYGLAGRLGEAGIRLPGQTVTVRGGPDSRGSSGPTGHGGARGEI